jgi:hypothetical protein
MVLKKIDKQDEENFQLAKKIFKSKGFELEWDKKTDIIKVKRNGKDYSSFSFDFLKQIL